MHCIIRSRQPWKSYGKKRKSCASISVHNQADVGQSLVWRIQECLDVNGEHFGHVLIKRVTNPAYHVHQISTFSALCKEYLFTFNCVYIFLGHPVY